MRRLTFLALLLPLTQANPLAAWPESRARSSFDERVAPVLIRACFDCHSGADPQGGLDLSQWDSVLRGGDSGPALNPRSPADSLLWQRVRDGEMPPKHPLSADDRRVVEEWIASGAAWGTDPIDPFRHTTSARAGYDWWSLQPLADPAIPATNDAWARNGIDRFVLQGLTGAGLAPSPEADRRTLIRRLSFDLLGLPPTPEDVTAFENDPSPDAYEQLVDRLLGSPHYGVRWGRHWLDIVRFGESQGFERDKLRENAWPYRDWVIQSLNADLPYDQFCRLQIAGDVLPGSDRDGIIAAGCLTCGPWDEVGQRQQSAAMKAVVRQDELEDYLGLVGQTFLGLTVHCARCHDHKFDPIRQEEYFRLAAALAGVRHGSRDVLSDADRSRKAQLAKRITEVRLAQQRLEGIARDRLVHAAEQSGSPPWPLARWPFQTNAQDVLGSLHGTLQGDAAVREGELQLTGGRAAVLTAALEHDLTEKTLEAWVQLDQLDQRGGAVIGVQSLDGAQFDAIVFGEQQPRRWMAGSDHFRRTKSFDGPEEAEAHRQPIHLAVTWHADGTITGYREGRPYGESYRSTGPVRFPAGQAQVVLGLRHLPSAAGKHLHGAITEARLYDRALTAEELKTSHANGPNDYSTAQLRSALDPEDQQEWDRILTILRTAQAEHDAIQPLSVYTVVPSPPEATHLLARGNPATPLAEVTPGAIAAVPGGHSDFLLPTNATDAARRGRLAHWVTHPENPLFSRVIVNRLWHYHFSAGLVATVSDLGFQGGRPSHPELLDWLAREFLQQGQSLKALHRLIVCSATYRQSSRFNAHAAAIDADNRRLWRKTPQRLEAEALRDAVLSVAGVLNTTLDGPGYRDFETFVRNSQFYEIRDKPGAEYQRRTVYRTWIRSGRSPLLDLFDCPDPSTKTPERAVTVTPLQALSLLNNSFLLRLSETLAERVRQLAGPDHSRQVQRLFLLAYQREPTPRELDECRAFVEKFGLADLVRVVLNTSEFLYLD